MFLALIATLHPNRLDCTSAKKVAHLWCRTCQKAKDQLRTSSQKKRNLPNKTYAILGIHTPQITSLFGLGILHIPFHSFLLSYFLIFFIGFSVQFEAKTLPWTPPCSAPRLDPASHLERETIKEERRQMKKNILRRRF